MVGGPDIGSAEALSFAASGRAALQTVHWRESLRELKLNAVEHLPAKIALLGNLTLPFWDSDPIVVFLASAYNAALQAGSRRLLSQAKPQPFLYKVRLASLHPQGWQQLFEARIRKMLPELLSAQFLFPWD